MTALLGASAFLSGSETALFALSQQELTTLKRTGGLGARATVALLATPRKLLITLLLGNMLANMTYFVLASVLALHAESALATTIWSIIPLIVIILVGEVLPKLVATAQRVAWCSRLSPAVLALHRASTLIRVPIDTLVIAPLERLIAPPAAPSLSREELARALQHAASQGVISEQEAALLARVAHLNKARVRSVMTPRVRMAWLPASASKSDLLDLIRASNEPITQAPVCDSTLDTGVVGVIDLRRALADPDVEELAMHCRQPVFVPEQATLRDLIEQLQRSGESLAIVVDEFGGVAGSVTLEQAADRLLEAIDAAQRDQEAK